MRSATVIFIKITLAGLMLAGLLCYRAAWAGGCTVIGEPRHYIVEVDQDHAGINFNTPGQVVTDAVKFDVAANNPMDCQCEGGSAALYFKSVIMLPPGYNDGNITYYKLNPSLQIGLKYRVNDGPLIPAPFEDVSDSGSYACGSDGIYHSPYTETGNRGTLSLYLVQGFTGKMVIPPTLLSQVYARWGTQGDYGVNHINWLFVFGDLPD